MHILGVSGLPRSMSFKRRHWPSLDEREYRMSQGHDAAAVLVSDGRIVAAAAEERFVRCKHTGAFPVRAIEFCLAEGGIGIDAVDEIVHGFDYGPYAALYAQAGDRFREVYSPAAFADSVAAHFPTVPPDRIRHLNHHLAHAASAYFTSGWDECIVAVIDGMGEVEGVSVYHAHDGSLHRIYRVLAADSIGIFYSLVTFHLGFDFNADEYKIMGLAPYGDPQRFRRFFEETIRLMPGGAVQIPPLYANRTEEDCETYLGTRRFLHEHLIPARAPEAELTQDHQDVAAALQRRLDEVVRHVTAEAARRHSCGRLAMAGGVALNCTANGALLRSGLFREIYVQPAAGDDGSALGAALYRAHARGQRDMARQGVPLWGPRYSEQDVRRAIATVAPRLDVVEFDDVAATAAAAAACIAHGEVIGWYRGRMEFGPRALGNRSILADPSRPGMRDRINAMIKMREAFRPFAPAVSIEEAHLWFDVEPMSSFPFMIVTVDVRPAHRDALPAITHVDGSARLQTVARDTNPAFHALLQAVGRETGKELVLNTSFNVKGQPIVNTPQEAIDTFLATGLDALFIGDRCIRRHAAGHRV